MKALIVLLILLFCALSAIINYTSKKQEEKEKRYKIEKIRIPVSTGSSMRGAHGSVPHEMRDGYKVTDTKTGKVTYHLEYPKHLRK